MPARQGARTLLNALQKFFYCTRFVVISGWYGRLHGDWPYSCGFTLVEKRHQRAKCENVSDGVSSYAISTIYHM